MSLTGTDECWSWQGTVTCFCHHTAATGAGLKGKTAGRRETKKSIRNGKGRDSMTKKQKEGQRDEHRFERLYKSMSKTHERQRVRTHNTK